ncbi:hypothetical protein PFMC_01276 [Plasmodium falciparum CAMP/Malaysia]|uniref:Uncharacterized protein n=1 Tax=Plasmodium falciparum (isolate Camp / Malaysia) TaxID=5835 RepID=A0A024XCD3_PLAFC|nr:hypothetical protein PFMC_01276 [Plasmodium falciparum CAMP/Malaysia]
MDVYRKNICSNNFCLCLYISNFFFFKRKFILFNYLYITFIYYKYFKNNYKSI